MRYSVCTRMNNPGEAKYLIEVEDTNDMLEAFRIASSMFERHENQDSFVEIVDNVTKENIAKFKEGDSGAKL